MANKPIDSFRGVKINSPLGKELLCRSLSGEEKLGELFEFHLDLRSPNRDIQFKDIVGQRVTVSLELKSGERYFNGFVSEFRFSGIVGKLAVYKATIRPWLWFLTRTADCRIFQNQKVPDIIKSVFSDNGMSDFDVRLSDSYREWDYCVQYRETDFNFINRLMEQEGIYYFFEHTETKHTLVLADGMGAHNPFPGYETLPYYPPDPNRAMRERDHITEWEVSQSIVPGKYAITDFDFEKPKVDLTAKLSETRPHAYPIADHEIFDYPGEYTEVSDGDIYVKKKLQELQAQHERVMASGNARGLCAGSLFTLENYPRKDQNKEYLVISVSHEIQNDDFETTGSAGNDDPYFCCAEVMDSAQPYRSDRLTPKPVVQGPQTAIVVGPDGEEIHCDKYARVKVQFHWDRYGKNDENSSCWVRVSQLWAGKSWGAIHIPRIGQEVLVSFLEGDPDQPMITGRVYNADNMPPYDLPANKTQSGIKSRSSKKGTAKHFNEFQFEDKKDKEKIYLHAEKDLVTMVENKEKRKTCNTRKTVVGTDDNRRPSEMVDGLLVHGARMVDVRGDDGLTVAHGKGRKVQIKDGAYDLEVQKEDYLLGVAMGDASIETKLGKITIKAMTSIELKVGTSSIKIDPTGVTIKGTLLNSKASGLNVIKGALVQIN